MSRAIRIAAALGLIGALVFGGTVAAMAGGQKVLDDSMTGLPASMTGQTFLGVKAGGLPWQLERGAAMVFADGRLQVQVTGLVLAAGSAKGTNPIPTGRALVSCGGLVAAESSVVPFSKTGDAMVNERVDLPSGCVAPTVFFAGIVASGPVWFAVTGW